MLQCLAKQIWMQVTHSTRYWRNRARQIILKTHFALNDRLANGTRQFPFSIASLHVYCCVFQWNGRRGLLCFASYKQNCEIVVKYTQKTNPRADDRKHLRSRRIKTWNCREFNGGSNETLTSNVRHVDLEIKTETCRTAASIARNCPNRRIRQFHFYFSTCLSLKALKNKCIRKKKRE